MSISCIQALHSQEHTCSYNLHSHQILLFSSAHRYYPEQRLRKDDSKAELCHHNHSLKRQEACQRFHMH